MARLVALLALLPAASALCPFALSNGGVLPSGHPPVRSPLGPRRAAAEGYAEALAALDFAAVRADIAAAFTNSQPWWPADYGTYAPFFIRLAWHCTGTYRTSDGRGGCDGARQRFDPEQSWDDNTNLDKARHLLAPIKEKYGLGLSWGDLITLTGTTAIEEMGFKAQHGPLGFCAGRVDDDSGHDSEPLGPGAKQDSLWPCNSGPGNPEQGNCSDPLGQSVVGLIYVDPHGPMGVPDPVGSAANIRDVFGRMTMDDYETVALIGGGHTFGKTHGACPGGAGMAPKDDPEHPWAGTCGTGTGGYATTSGFEGPWTSNPAQWDNDYFKNLLRFESNWTKLASPAEQVQWYAPGGARAPRANDSAAMQDVMMLTTDVALLNDDAYKAIVQSFAADIDAFAAAFGAAWYKLMTRDMGPVTRCFNSSALPDAQAWQNPLPPPAAQQPSWAAVATDLRALLAASPADGPLFVRLAWQCASTYRGSDFQGGCNGARIRLAPGKDWPENAGLDVALALLQPVQAKHAAEGLTWADLIVLAGTLAVEAAAGGALDSLAFCGGRSDAAESDPGWAPFLESGLTGGMADSGAALLDRIELWGLEPREYVALSGAHSMGSMHKGTSGYNGTWVSPQAGLSSTYFQNLMDFTWTEAAAPGGGRYYVASLSPGGAAVHALHSDLLLRFTPELATHALEFAGDQSAFLAAFGAAWTKVMNADRFDGPTGTRCALPVAAPPAASGGATTRKLIGAAFMGVAATAAVAGGGAYVMYRRHKQLGRKALQRIEEEEEALDAPLLAESAR